MKINDRYQNTYSDEIVEVTTIRKGTKGMVAVLLYLEAATKSGKLEVGLEDFEKRIALNQWKKV